MTSLRDRKELLVLKAYDFLPKMTSSSQSRGNMMHVQYTNFGSLFSRNICVLFPGKQFLEQPNTVCARSFGYCQISTKVCVWRLLKHFFFFWGKYYLNFENVAVVKIEWPVFRLICGNISWKFHVNFSTFTPILKSSWGNLSRNQKGHKRNIEAQYFI